MPLISLDNSVCSTLSTACFLPCNKFATIFKHGLITDSALLYGFLLHKHKCYMERRKEKNFFVSRAIFNQGLKGKMLLATNSNVVFGKTVLICFDK